MRFSAAPTGGEAVAAASAASGHAARDDGVNGGVKKRKRGAAKIESQIVEQRLKINKKNTFDHERRWEPTHSAREKAALEKWRGELARLEEQLETLQESLGAARRAEEAKQAAAEKKAMQAKEQAAAEAHMSEAGACELVELVMKMNARFVNKSDTVDAVWAHVHKLFMQLVERGDLPSSDGRPVGALKLR